MRDPTGPLSSTTALLSTATRRAPPFKPSLFSVLLNNASLGSVVHDHSVLGVIIHLRVSSRDASSSAPFTSLTPPYSKYVFLGERRHQHQADQISQPPQRTAVTCLCFHCRSLGERRHHQHPPTVFVVSSRYSGCYYELPGSVGCYRSRSNFPCV